MSGVVVVGDVMMDVIVHMHVEMQRGSDAPANIATTFGGVGSNVAAWLGYHHADVRLVSVVGDDPWGHLINQHLTALGVTSFLKVAPNVATGIVVALAHPDGERSMFPDSRANQLLGHDQFTNDSLWSNASWLYMSGYTLLQPQTTELALHVMRMARKRGIKVLLDPASSAPLQALTSQQLNQWFELTDVLVPNEQELSVLAPAATFEESLALLGRHIPTVIAKRGADGAYIIEQGQVQHVPSKPVDVIDTVGAGDAFASGLLYGLTQNLNFFDAAVQGVETATLALNTRGAQPANPLS